MAQHAITTKNREYNSVVITTLKIANTIVLLTQHYKEICWHEYTFIHWLRDK